MSSVNSSNSSATLSNSSCKPRKCGPLTFQCACLACRPRSRTSARCWLSRSMDLRRIGSGKLFWVLCNVGFIRSVGDTPPVPLLHAGQIRTTQAHAAEHVDLEEPPPILIGNIRKRLWLETAEVVHGNVHEREPLEQHFRRRCGGEIACEAFNPGIRHGLINLLFRLRHRLFRTPVHDDPCAFAGESGGDGKSNSFGGARDEGCFVS